MVVVDREHSTRIDEGKITIDVSGDSPDLSGNLARGIKRNERCINAGFGGKPMAVIAKAIPSTAQDRLGDSSHFPLHAYEKRIREGFIERPNSHGVALRLVQERHAKGPFNRPNCLPHPLERRLGHRSRAAITLIGWKPTGPDLAALGWRQPSCRVSIAAFEAMRRPDSNASVEQVRYCRRRLGKIISSVAEIRNAKAINKSLIDQRRSDSRQSDDEYGR